jgi:hypothetical protein
MMEKITKKYIMALLGGRHLAATHNNQSIVGAAVVGRKLVMRRVGIGAYGRASYHLLG